MKSKILSCAIFMLPFLLSSCDSSNSTDSPSDPILEKLRDYKGVANGTITIEGNARPIEFVGFAMSTYFDLRGYTDLAAQDTGWFLYLSTYWTTGLPAKFGEGINQINLFYFPKPDSVQCKYEAKAGTVTVDSFITQKTGATRYFTTSGKSTFTATGFLEQKYPAGTCPDKQVEVIFSDVGIWDTGANL